MGSKKWFFDLSRLGFTQNKSKALQVPTIPTKYFGHFVRGYFDGDGCVYFNKLKYSDRARKRWILITLFTSGSRIFLVTLWGLLKRHGVIGGSLKKKKTALNWFLVIATVLHSIGLCIILLQSRTCFCRVSGKNWDEQSRS